MSDVKTELLSSLLLFTRAFFKLRTGHPFELSEPEGRESHYVTICRELMKVFTGETSRLIINVPPRYGKTELLIHFVAWALARYPDSNFIYVSYAHSLAKKQTQTIRNIINLAAYRKLFAIELNADSTAKDNFELDKCGTVFAAGAQGPITGRGAGIQGCDRFGGAIVIDDIHKPDEATSDTIRQGINDWYYNTLQSRVNDPKTPIIFIGQRVHEDDLASNLIATGGWRTLIIPALDVHNNALHPKKHSRADLLKMKENSEYVFAAQYQQDPQPAGGGIFKEEWFVIHEYEPKILATFITIDTAETDKSYNDATVFSFWGLYRVDNFGIEAPLFALHWLDCSELRIEPKDLEAEFRAFYVDCMGYPVKPVFVGIEKKSTGVTLLSVLNQYQGLRVIDTQFKHPNGKLLIQSKAEKFDSVQQYVAQKLISLPYGANHTKMCIEHCRKITRNMTHRFDDIADTLASAIRLGLIDKILTNNLSSIKNSDIIAKKVMSNFSQYLNLRRG